MVARANPREFRLELQRIGQSLVSCLLLASVLPALAVIPYRTRFYQWF
jgi:hypothetical protein